MFRIGMTSTSAVMQDHFESHLCDEVTVQPDFYTAVSSRACLVRVLEDSIADPLP